jgi:O-antigen/teichoic acid export membrane protein
VRKSVLGPGPWLRVRNLISGLGGQTGFYAFSLVAASLASAVAGVIVARSVSTTQFGVYSFALTTLTIAGLLFEFGLFFPAARIAAHQLPPERHATVGAAVTLFAPVALLFGATILGLSLVIDRLFTVHAGIVLFAAAPLAFVIPFRVVAQWLAQGIDRLNIFSLAYLVSGALFIAGLVGSRQLTALNASNAVLIQLATLLIGWLGMLAVLRPRFDALSARWRELLRHAREYGFEVYVGRVFSVGTYQMDVIMLGALANAPTVGYYVLAGAIGNGATLAVLAFGTAAFGRLLHRPSIPRNYLIWCWVAGLSAAGLATALAAPFISLVYSHRYLPAASLVLPLALAAAVRVVTNLYNSFLSAHGDGRALRNAGTALTVSNVVLNATLIPVFLAPGAAWASFGAQVINYLFHLYGYRRTTARLQMAWK